MSGAVTATTVLAGAAVAATAYSIYAGERAAGAQKDALNQQNAAQKQALAAADQQARAADEAMNKANRKSPDMAAVMNQAAGRDGQSSTMLTGPQGVDPSALALGKNTLLGG